MQPTAIRFSHVFRKRRVLADCGRWHPQPADFPANVHLQKTRLIAPRLTPYIRGGCEQVAVRIQ